MVVLCCYDLPTINDTLDLILIAILAERKFKK